MTNREATAWWLILIAMAIAWNPGFAAAQTAQDDQGQVQNNWDAFLHYSLIGRWQLAQDHGQALLQSNPDPMVLLQLVQSERYAQSYTQLTRLQEEKTPVADLARQVIHIIEKGRYQLRRDPDRIHEEVQRLAGTTRGRMLAIRRLKDSGEWAVPIMIEVLRDPQRTDEYALIKWALPQLGRPAVEPLVVVLQNATGLNLRLVVAEVLGKLGYDTAAPYLLEVIQAPDATSELKAAALKALGTLEHGDDWQGMPASLAFDKLAGWYYDAVPSVMPAENRELANIWFWSADQGLYPEEVARDAFDELMTMRSCERSTQLDTQKPDPIALWLSAFFRLEAQGHPQPTYFGEHHADAATYALTAGPQYLHRTLKRALDNKNRPVALAAIEVLRRNSGQQSLLYRLGQGQPLIRALSFPDRQVRFSAALAIAGAIPSQAFAENDQVVDILVQALRQKGDTAALLVEPDQATRTELAAQLRTEGAFAQVVAASTFGEAARQLETLPSCDLVVLSSEIADPALARALQMMQDDYRLAFCPTIVIAPENRIAVVRQIVDSYRFARTVVRSTPLAEMLTTAQAVLEASSARTFDAALADQVAGDAATVLQRLAMAGNEVLQLKRAEDALIDALGEARDNIQLAAIETLARMDSTPAQRALVDAALDTQRDMDRRLMLLERLALSAKNYGNLLLGEQVEALYVLIQDPQADPRLRNQAAEAYGSLNLPSERISQLILQQAKLK